MILKAKMAVEHSADIPRLLHGMTTVKRYSPATLLVSSDQESLAQPTIITKRS